MQGIHIFIVDDHKLFREGLKLLLTERIPDIKIQEANHGKEFLDRVDKSLPDIVFMDINMPVLGGIACCKKYIERYPDANVIALSMYGDEHHFSAMRKAGAKGFIYKNSKFDEVLKAISELLNGNCYYSSKLCSKQTSITEQKKETNSLIRLTEKENEVIFYICSGLSNLEIANKLGVSKSTIGKHRENIFVKTGVRNTAELVHFVIKNHLIEI